MPDEREEAWFAVHEALPPGWRVGRGEYDPGRHKWAVSAYLPTHRRGKMPETLEGLGVDEVTALWALHALLLSRG